ncbi:pyridoxal 5'-phosphate synthase glutaminase subunit PdxT [bacterium]|nr:pyridoxal 5'-phosphate synthase glutaminase subunit PdxT [bacterium]
MKVGVLALQGDVAEHASMLSKIDLEPVPIKYIHELEGIEALIIPGGESTTINRLADFAAAELLDRIKEKALKERMPVYGTCMGSIMLAKSVEGSDQKTLCLMDITVRRNAYGPQKASFEADIAIRGEALPYPAVFIRAPQIISAGKDVEILARGENEIFMARQKNLLATTFHPELTEDTRVHEFFKGMIEEILVKEG